MEGLAAKGAYVLIVREILLRVHQAVLAFGQGVVCHGWVSGYCHCGLACWCQLHGGDRWPQVFHGWHLAKCGDTHAQQEVEGENRNQPSRHGGQIIRAGP
ncbi:MAG: hypothetical protein KUL84_12305 [Diaphorobacter sp.]|nr:hypothetical protein [Diaphorobacter sp.]